MTPGGTVDSKTIMEYLARFRGIEVTQAESTALAAYWNGLQALRIAARATPSNDVPMAVGFDPTKTCGHG